MTKMPPPRGRCAQAVRADLVITALLFSIIASGCWDAESEKLPYTRLALPYERTQLKSSTSLQVLKIAHDPAYQFLPREAEPVLLTQSDTTIAYSGRSAQGLKTWLNMVVFEGSRMAATRKYFFCIDEHATIDPSRPEHHWLVPRPGLLFDSECLIGPEVLTTPYATEEAQKIALVKWLAERFQGDVTALAGRAGTFAQGNEQIAISGMMVRQVFQSILTKLAQSPGLAQNLGTDQGIPFPHPSLGEGRLRLLVGSDTAVVMIRVNLPLTPVP
ncbi:MAG: hypothetical protein M1376_00665 [Planctomycetes bacterium]|nr:hypothetical protein [Planctomycetota bacterium]